MKFMPIREAVIETTFNREETIKVLKDNTEEPGFETRGPFKRKMFTGSITHDSFNLVATLDHAQIKGKILEQPEGSRVKIKVKYFPFYSTVMITLTICFIFFGFTILILMMEKMASNSINPIEIFASPIKLIKLFAPFLLAAFSYLTWWAYSVRYLNRYRTKLPTKSRHTH